MVNAMPDICKLPRVARNLVLVGATILAATAHGQTSGPPSGPDSKTAPCRAIKDDAVRLRCYEAATSDATTSPAPPVPGALQASSTPAERGLGADLWRLVRTPNPAGGRGAISIMQTADVAKSDIDLAGLMIRCGETNLETLIVLVTPLPPRAHPKITVTAGGAKEEFIGTIVPPGATVLLPNQASALASGPWQTASALAVQIENGADRAQGIIPLAGLGAALPALMMECRAR